MKKKIAKNLGLKILSLVLALIFWLVVVNLDDPTISRTFRNINVQIINQNAISSINQVFDVVNGDKVNVTVKGKKSVVDQVKAEDLIATADLSNMSQVNAVSIKVVLNRYFSNMPDLDWDNQMLKISLEEKKTQQFKVNIIQTGTAQEGYYVGNCTVKPNIIEVTGGTSKIQKISSVGVELNINNAADTFKVSLKPIPFDSNGNKIDTTNLKFSSDSINVETEILKTKTISVSVDIKGEPADGFKLTQTDFKPDNVVVAGTEKNLEGVDSITIPFDITGLSADVEKEIELSSYVPKNIQLEDSQETVSLRCTIQQMQVKTIKVNDTNIKLLNIPKDMNFLFNESLADKSIQVRGMEENLRDLSESTIDCYIDLNGMKEGKQKATVQFKLPDGVQLNSVAPQIKIKLVKSGTEAEATASPVPTLTP